MAFLLCSRITSTDHSTIIQATKLKIPFEDNFLQFNAMKTYETFNFTNRYLFFINVIQFIQNKILICLHIKHNKYACNYKLLYLFDLTFQIIFIKSSCLGESQLPYSIFISILRCLNIACITRDMLCYSMTGKRNRIQNSKLFSTSGQKVQITCFYQTRSGMDISRT